MLCSMPGGPTALDALTHSSNTLFRIMLHDKSAASASQIQLSLHVVW